MRHKKTFVAITVLIAALSFQAVAQKKVQPKDLTYWCMVKNADGSGAEEYDMLRFSDGTLISESAGLPQNGERAKVVKSRNGNSSKMNARVEKSDGSVMVYDCTLENGVIHGTIDIVSPDGSSVRKVVRGMIYEQYLQIRKEKEEYSKSNPTK